MWVPAGTLYAGLALVLLGLWLSNPEKVSAARGAHTARRTPPISLSSTPAGRGSRLRRTARGTRDVVYSYVFATYDEIPHGSKDR